MDCAVKEVIAEEVAFELEAKWGEMNHQYGTLKHGLSSHGNKMASEALSIMSSHHNFQSRPVGSLL